METTATVCKEMKVNLGSAFEKRGYDYLRSFVPLNEIKNFQDALELLFLNNSADSKNIYEAAVNLDKNNKEALYKIYQIAPKLREFSRLKEYFFKHLEEIFPGRNYVDLGSGVLFGLPQDQRLTWTWHQESTYHPGIENIVHYWIPLFNPSSTNNGAMSVLEGTHKLGSLPYNALKPFENGGTSLIPKNIDELVKNFKEENFEINIGDAAFFHKELVHRSNYNASDKTRFTLVYRLAAIDSLPEQHEFSTLVAQTK